ncbi:MAG: DUF58 domain-containing protein [Treponema sp.]|jgi:uncharacterized protein (DUF58 family)|nr:DUF58 domain-containing protein [Treponema sp.]
MSRSSAWDTVEIHREKLLYWGIAVLVPVYIFTPAAIVQFFCLFFLFILIGSRLYSAYLIRNIRVTRMDRELRVFRHEWVRMELKVENHGLLPAFMLAAGDITGSLQVFSISKILCTLGRRAWTPLRWEGLCADRGIFSIGPAVIRGADPLGLFPFYLKDTETSKLFVYPRLRSVRIKMSGGIPLGNMLSANPLYEDITRYRSLRPYNSGDEPRRINWKVSAHVSGDTRTQSNGLLVNEYETTASYPLMIFLNLDSNEYPLKKRVMYMERAIEAAAALCLNASRGRQVTGIIIFTSDDEGGISVIPPESFTFVPILERLAAITWKSSAGKKDVQTLSASVKVMLDQGKRLPYGTRYVYTGPDQEDEAYIVLNSLKRHHLRLEYIIIDERAISSIAPDNSPRYQMKESGYEIV